VFSGWLGVFLDTIGESRDDWDEVAAILIGAYRNIAPKALVEEPDRETR
jgi:hypothetical protein